MRGHIEGTMLGNIVLLTISYRPDENRRNLNSNRHIGELRSLRDEGISFGGHAG
jgi:hypothetical protein